MTRRLHPLLALAAMIAAPAHAHSEPAVETPAVAAAAGSLQASMALAAIDFVNANHRASRWQGQRQYGPFRVVAPDRVEMIGATDRATPEQFAAMLRDYPGIRRIDMVDCPGTHDDRANLKLGRMIRAAGLATHVPADGSVRSGAVDLFLAGRERVIANGAEFAVHSWKDAFGREARDYAPDAAPNRQYLDYYREMGMGAAQARAFYNFTNSVAHNDALWLEAGEMRAWVSRTIAPRPVLASAPAARPMEVRLAEARPMEVRLAGRIGSGGLALLDRSMTDRTEPARAYPAMALAMLDSEWRL